MSSSVVPAGILVVLVVEFPDVDVKLLATAAAAAAPDRPPVYPVAAAVDKPPAEPVAFATALLVVVVIAWMPGIVADALESTAEVADAISVTGHTVVSIVMVCVTITTLPALVVVWACTASTVSVVLPVIAATLLLVLPVIAATLLTAVLPLIAATLPALVGIAWMPGIVADAFERIAEVAEAASDMGHVVTSTVMVFVTITTLPAEVEVWVCNASTVNVVLPLSAAEEDVARTLDAATGVMGETPLAMLVAEIGAIPDGPAAEIAAGEEAATASTLDAATAVEGETASTVLVAEIAAILVALAAEIAADVALEASDNGTTVVASVVVRVVVTGTVAEPKADERSGQSVTVGAQL